MTTDFFKYRNTTDTGETLLYCTYDVYTGTYYSAILYIQVQSPTFFLTTSGYWILDENLFVRFAVEGKKEIFAQGQK